MCLSVSLSLLCSTLSFTDPFFHWLSLTALSLKPNLSLFLLLCLFYHFFLFTSVCLPMLLYLPVSVFLLCMSAMSAGLSLSLSHMPTYIAIECRLNRAEVSDQLQLLETKPLLMESLLRRRSSKDRPSEE